MRDLGTVLPTAGLSASLLFGAVAWHAHYQARHSGETGFATLFGVRESFDPMDFNPKPLRRAEPAPALDVEKAPRFDPLSGGAYAKPSLSLVGDGRPVVTIFLAP
jgi:hypothetical protein